MDWSSIKFLLSMTIESIISLVLIGFVLVWLRYLLNWLFNVDLNMKKLQTGLYFFALIITVVALYNSVFNNPNSPDPVVDGVAGNLIIIVVVLCLLPSIQPLLPSIKSMKILDFIEFNREIKQVKESVNSGLDNINRTLSMLIAIQNVTVSQNANLRTEVTVNLGTQVDDIKKLIDNLKLKYNIDERDIPLSATSVDDKTSSLLRLRLNIEEKLRSIAPLVDIPPSPDVLKIVKSLQGRELIDRVLAESIEKIIRVTKEVTEMGIELQPNLADEIITSGELVLVAINRVDENIQRRRSRNNENFSRERNNDRRSNL